MCGETETCIGDRRLCSARRGRGERVTFTVGPFAAGLRCQGRVFAVDGHVVMVELGLGLFFFLRARKTITNMLLDHPLVW